MKPPLFEYFAPESVEEAVALRARHPASSVLAGGQSLIPALNFRLAAPDAVIDLRRIDELARIEVRDGEVRVGAMTRQRDFELHDGAYDANPLIRETLRLVAHAVVRNRGTVGGSMAHADPAAELPALLRCLDGSVTVRGRVGERVISARDLFLFHLTTSLGPDEILTEVRLPALGPRTGWSFQEVARRHGDYALAGVCCTVTVSDRGRCTHASLAACGVAATPVRLEESERVLIDSSLEDDAVGEAARLSRDAVTAADDVQASVEFRRDLLRTLVRRSVGTAMRRIQEDSDLGVV